MSEWTNELVDWWVDGWVSYFSLLCYFFTERPLGWATSSLSYFFSEQPLFWATSLSCLPASSFAASATQLFSSRSPHSAFCNVQLQFRVAQEWTIRAAAPMRLATSSCNPARQERRSITNALLRAAVPMRFRRSQLQTRVAPNRPTFAQRQQCRLFRAIIMLRSSFFYIFLRCLCEMELSLLSRAHFADLIFQKCSENNNMFI